MIFENKGHVDIWDNCNLNLKSLPENIIFQNKGFVKISNNNKSVSLPNNMIVSNNVTVLFLYDIPKLKINQYSNYFPKINEYNFNIFKHLSDKLIFEKICINLQDFQNNPYKTPHICLSKVLNNTKNKEFVNIKLPNNFLSLSSWI